MKKHLKTAAKVFFVVTWLALFVYFVLFAIVVPFFSNLYKGPDDVSRRVTAPDGSKTALLVRDFHFIDLNFRLFIVENSWAELPSVRESIWSSLDYEPTTRNWYEDIEWSLDSSVIAVLVEGEYIFAYDFSTGLEIEDHEHIRSLLESRSDLQD